MQIDTSSKKDSHKRSQLLNQTNFLDVKSSSTKQSAISRFSLSKLKPTPSKNKGSASSLSGEKQNYLLYKSYIDLSSEYKMNKIKLINEDFMELVRDLKSKRSQVIGYFVF
ncbi:UNKNOWN [Stylonychia lemnae]|uniref:Uncharacterized protein n=1 Tax=Stylonychia lemnae TaxID=5949 RepID=A0A078ARL2_STYLE|nr:UNKNOWN [Stylonychia lemnae]|eukprot:CDW85110.1 UNKNOWN [Stylonychia lemnae]